MYVNDLLVRDDNAVSGDLGGGTSDLGRRLFAIEDANFDVMGLVSGSSSGAVVVQRYEYTPYGTQTVYNISYGSLSSDTYHFGVGFQGGLMDGLTGLVHFDARDYDPVTGRWLEEEPYGGAYVDGVNLYEAFKSSPISHVDWTGLDPSSPFVVDPSTGLLVDPPAASIVFQPSDALDQQTEQKGQLFSPPSDEPTSPLVNGIPLGDAPFSIQFDQNAFENFTVSSSCPIPQQVLDSLSDEVAESLRKQYDFMAQTRTPGLSGNPGAVPSNPFSKFSLPFSIGSSKSEGGAWKGVVKGGKISGGGFGPIVEIGNPNWFGPFAGSTKIDLDINLQKKCFGIEIQADFSIGHGADLILKGDVQYKPGAKAPSFGPTIIFQPGKGH